MAFSPESLVSSYEAYERFDGTTAPATVNWASVGSVDTKFAREFAQALLDACDKLDLVNSITQGKL